MPHSVLVKIQAGGLRGLQRLLAGTDACASIPDVGDLIAQAIAHFGGPEHIPYDALDEDILSFRLERRAGRRRG
jgi:hypothetical protein